MGWAACAGVDVHQTGDDEPGNHMLSFVATVEEN